MSDIVERLRRGPIDTEKCDEAADTITTLRADNERLRAALRGAYEVYAGSDGFIPETCAEGYQQQIIKQMVDCITAALTQEKPND
jgi:hypothetical protein